MRQDSCDGISRTRNMERVQKTQHSPPPLSLNLNRSRNLLAFFECAAQKERSKVLLQPLSTVDSHPKRGKTFEILCKMYNFSVQRVASQRFPEVQLSATTFVWPEGEALSGACLLVSGRGWFLLYSGNSHAAVLSLRKSVP